MKRSLLLLALVFVLGVPVLAEGGIGTLDATDDGRPRVVVMLDPSTGKFIFADEIDALPLVPAAAIPTGNPLGIDLMATVPKSVSILSAPNGFDMDHDSAREFLIRTDNGDLNSTRFEIYESTGNDTFGFVRVHVIDVPGFSSNYPYDVGDADNDGLTDLTVFGYTSSDFYVRLYESVSTNTYPTEIVWEVDDGPGWAVGAKIADTDNDGLKEVVVAGQGPDYKQRIAIYENTGDNSYTETFFVDIPEMHTSQSMEVADDLDGDGWDEILFGGLAANGGTVYAFEATSDNTYEQIWSAELTHPDGQIVNAEFIRYAGDLDGDGKKEFLVGGLKTISEPAPFYTILYVFEVQSNDDFEIVATLSLPRNISYNSGAEVADVDADGKKEIVFASGEFIAVYQNTGDNSWEQIWIAPAKIKKLGVGDLDGDGAQEIIFNQGNATSIFEGIIVDSDRDGVSNVLDNCPFDPNPAQEDADNDTVGDACDNCIYGPNTEQGSAIFGQDVVAEDSETFSWPVGADVVFVKGDLANVSTYTVDLVDSLALTSELMDSSLPDSGAGFYYLVRPDCAVGSWQTSLGAEPERDLALP